MAGLFDTGANALLSMGQGTIQPQTNQLQNIAAAQGVQNQALEYHNALLGQKARVAIGNALARHVRKDGSIDYGSAIADAASNPDAAYGLPDAVTQNNSQQAQNIGNQGAQLELNQRKTGMLAGLAAPLMSNPDVTKGDVARQLGVGVAHGLISMDQAQAAYSALPDDSAGIRQQVRGLLDASIGPAHAYNDAYGSMQLVDDGGTLHWQNVGSPASGQGGQNVGGSIAKQTSPETNSTPMDVVNPDGSHSYVRRDQVVGGAQGRPTVPPEVMGSGRYPAQQPANPGYQAAPAAGQVEGQRAAAEVAGHAAGEQFGQAGQLSAGFGDRMYRSQKALQLLQEISPSSGKPAELHNRIVNVALSLGMTNPSDKAAAYDEANKYLTQLAASQPGAAHSDAQLATALAGNPSTHINNLAAQDALRANIALDRRANAAYLAFHQKYPGTEAQVHANEWPTFQNDYTTKKDARAFMFDIMSPEQRARLWSGMDGKQRQAFRSELRGAMETGLVQAPN
ncbi:hypothetical protein IGS75_01465 [Gluconobacter sphaericus]|uniref:hypothetical protein n=1 Tax=Gluconobacter sphaericus TaxID=574987 RepID=UPI0019226618|nr:hypothetical protein [Gluconobacter sphaericus]QQX91339.1 hypothetical protein IGS75_01465 [Gluconobacter sphaericus]